MDLNHLITNITEIEDNNQFQELISQNICRNVSKDEISTENVIQCQNISTTCDQQIDVSNDFSLQLLSDYEMDTKLTPSLDVKANVSRRKNLFAIHNRRQLFENNFCVDNEKYEVDHKMGDKVEDNLKWDNTLGLSPVKKQLVADNDINTSSTKSLFSLSDFRNNSVKDFEDINEMKSKFFSLNEQQMEMESLLGDISFKSLSKCSDLDLRPEDKNIDINETFRSPNSRFENKSITSYFKQNSEPISSIKSKEKSIALKTMDNNWTKDFSDFDKSFAPVFDEIDSSNSMIESVHKLIERKNRKRKSLSMASLNSADDIRSEESFTPSVNSTLNCCEDISDKEMASPVSAKSSVTSGLGTLTTMGKTYSMPNCSNSQSIGLMNGNALNLNQLLFVSPNVLSLTMGCFVEFKLNYLKVRNLSITSFKVEIKLQTNVDILNSFEISYPKQTINIPAFFDGLLTDEITIIPLKTGSFCLCFQLFVSIEGINLPISPMSVICNIKVEEVIIKRPLFSSQCLQFKYNLFEDMSETQSIDLYVFNRQIVNEIPIKMSLDSNKCIVFDPMYRNPDSAIHTFRFPDSNTLFLVTKTHYEMRIPIRIQSYGVRQTESCLTVSTDSQRSHVLAVIRLSATFWPTKELKEPSLQCSQTTITLKTNEWKEIHFRNKSKENLIRVSLKCLAEDRNKNSVKLSTSQLMIPPLQKASICLLSDERTISGVKTHLLVTSDSGFGKSFKISIPIEIISNKNH